MENKTAHNKTVDVKRSSPHTSLLLVLFSFFSCLLLVHCSDPNVDAPTVNEFHPPAWMDPTQKGATEYHGTDVAVNGTDSCKLCHGASLQGVDDIPGCANTCHFGTGGELSPPGSGWEHPASPHSAPSLVRNAAICNQCHTITRKYSLGPVACHDCHGVGINHPTGQAWLDPYSTDFHGRSSLACTSCHNLTSDCIECHFGSSGSKAPAGSNWTHGNNDGHKDFEAFQAVCNKCHSLDRSYGNPPASCHDCHGSGINHPTGQDWLDPFSTDFHGQSSLDCASCHTLASDCIECHFGSSGSKAPVGSGWTHGDNDGHKDFEAFQTVCNRCHNLDRSYGNPPSSCHDCHEDDD